MTDLAEFLRARLDEDEQAALAAAQRSDRAWRYTVTAGDPDGYSLDLSDERILIVDWTNDDELLPSEAEHIARHDPARVLREVEAKRQLVREISTLTEFDWGEPDGSTRSDYVEAFRRVLRLLALPYADHPDYREEWKP